MNYYLLSEDELKALLKEQREICSRNIDYEQHGSQVEIFYDTVASAPSPPLPEPIELPNEGSVNAFIESMLLVYGKNNVRASAFALGIKTGADHVLNRLNIKP